MFAMIPWIVVILFLLHIVRIQDDGLFVTIAGFSLAFFAIFYTLDRVVMIERRAFRCTKCGYDLQGLSEHRCPECGTDFDPREKEKIEARIGMPRPRRKYQWIAAVVITLLTLALIGNIVLMRRARRRPVPTPPTPPVASAPVQ